MPDAPISLDFHAAHPLDPLQRFAAWASEARGWPRCLMALLLGALAAAALPPVDLVPLVVVSFSGLIWLAEGCRRKRDAFALGWSFGFGFFVAGLYWVAISIFTDIATFWWALPFAVAGLPAVLGVYTGLALLLYHVVAPRGAGRAFALGVAWTGAEWLRGHLLTGFPWNLAGYVWSGGFPGAGAVLQSTSVIGIYGLGLVTVILAGLPASLGDPPLGPVRLRRAVPVLVALLIAAAIGAAGALRLAGATDTLVPDVRLRLVQPSIPQTLKWDPAAQRRNFERLLTLSRMPGADGVTDVLWPEAAATYLLNRDAEARAAIAAVAPAGGLVIAGGLRANPAPDPVREIWNSLVAINGDGEIIASFDKYHLVPFGEYVPMRSLLPFKKLTAGSLDFSAGAGPRTVDLPGLPPAGPMICYEVIFPGAVVEPSRRPGWLLNITNDAWFGFSSGPFQHFAIARTRAVEEGLPLVRVANNGISGVMDPYGRVIKRLGLDDVGIIDSALPAALPATPYARFGDLMLLPLMVVAAAAATRRAGISGVRPR
jgi:apolipoprotein N-acyltransferase